MIVALGQTTMTREAILSAFVAKAIQSAEAAGAGPAPYLVKPGYYAEALAQGTGMLRL